MHLFLDRESHEVFESLTWGMTDFLGRRIGVAVKAAARAVEMDVRGMDEFEHFAEPCPL